MLHQLLQGLWFYIIFSLLGLLALPLTLKLLSKNFEFAYFLAKPLGLALFGYVIWLLASLKIISYQNNYAVFGLLIVSLLAALYFVVREYPKLKGQIKFKNVLWLELISLLLYVGYLWLRSHNSSAYGTERFMDMALLNSSLKADHFPFTDPWYAGQNVNYYYYGHYLMSVLTKVSGISTFLTYNFSIAFLYTTSFLLSALLVFDIARSKVFAALSGFLVTTAGSLFYSFLVLLAWLSDKPITSYASSTRLYTPSYIINEIPSYSFTVGDLHAHFLALPFFVMSLCLLYVLSKSERISKTLAVSLLIAFVTAALVNPSDVTTIVGLFVLLWIYKIYKAYKEQGSIAALFKPSVGRQWIVLSLFLGLGLIILYLPFLLNFTSPVLGFGLAPLYAKAHGFLFSGYQYPSPFPAFLGMWGMFVLSILIILYNFRAKLKDHTFEILAFVGAVGLIAFVEVFFVKDIYHIANPPFFRANTVFKYGYHTWTLLSISFCALVAAVFRELKLNKRYKGVTGPLSLLLVIFFILGLVYPYQAMDQFYFSSTTPKTLSAADFMQIESPEDLETVNWLNQNVYERSVILEAVGDSYSYFSRMATFTGNITLMGWKTHEWTWRFEGREAAKILATNPTAAVETGYGKVSAVAVDADVIYQNPDLELTKQLLTKYGVEYVYIGNLEKTTYPNLIEAKFPYLGTVVFNSGQSKLFKINQP